MEDASFSSDTTFAFDGNIELSNRGYVGSPDGESGGTYKKRCSPGWIIDDCYQFLGDVGYGLLMVIVREETKERRLHSGISFSFLSVLLFLLSSIGGKKGRERQKGKEGSIIVSSFRLRKQQQVYNI